MGIAMTLENFEKGGAAGSSAIVPAIIQAFFIRAIGAAARRPR
jgi:hypothetical protein